MLNNAIVRKLDQDYPVLGKLLISNLDEVQTLTEKVTESSSPAKMLYNAIVRKLDQDYPVIGKILISNLNEVPPSWRVQFRGEILPRNTNMDSLMCSNKEPIHLFKPRTLVDDPTMIQILVKSSITGKVITVLVSPDDTIGMVKDRFFTKDGTPPEQLRLIFGGSQLEDFGTVKSYKISKDSTLTATQRLLGGLLPHDSVDAAFSTVDLQAKTISGEGIKSTDPWNWDSFTIGLNLRGTCPISTCISNKGNSVVYFQAKYGTVRMTRSNNKFECPACKFTAAAIRKSPGCSTDRDRIGMFCPTNFVVRYGRSVFRYKKCGVHQPVRVAAIESYGCNYEYKEFDESDGPSDYDHIEIVTVGPGSSPYYCVVCDRACMNTGPGLELRFPCGHVHHKKCAPASGQCYICETKVLIKLEDDNGNLKLIGGPLWNRRDAHAYLRLASSYHVDGFGRDNGAAHVEFSEMEFMDNILRMRR